MRSITFFLAAAAVFCAATGDVNGRGGGRGFGGGYGGSRGGYSGGANRGYSGGSGQGFSSYSGYNRAGGGYSGSRSGESYSGAAGRGYSGSYDRSYATNRGGTVSTSGERGAYEGRYGGGGAYGSRDTSVTTAGGKTYSGDRQGAVATGPMGRTVGGASRSYEGRNGSGSWETAFAGNRYTGNMNHYASVYGANGVHSTAYWSSGNMATRAGYVRTGFGYYNCFHPAWYTAHPGCWAATGWAAGYAWTAANYVNLLGYWGLPAVEQAPDYDYGSTVVYQGNNVYVNGEDTGTAQQFSQQATQIAEQGQASTAAPADDWKPLGVYALVQGDEKSSNNIFQLAANKDGTIRGNYYDGLMDATTEVYGSVDKKTQRAAWTIGKKKDRVFEAGIFNLTKDECPCLVHVGTEKTDQLMLVRMQKPAESGNAATPPSGGTGR